MGRINEGVGVCPSKMPRRGPAAEVEWVISNTFMIYHSSAEKKMTVDDTIDSITVKRLELGYRGCYSIVLVQIVPGYNYSHKNSIQKTTFCRFIALLKKF